MYKFQSFVIAVLLNLAKKEAVGQSNLTDSLTNCR